MRFAETQRFAGWIRVIVRAEIHTYRALSDREYWGTHFWGLGTGMRGRAFLYLMKRGRGVRLELRDGTRLLVGSRRPEALTGAISLVSMG